MDVLNNMYKSIITPKRSECIVTKHYENKHVSKSKSKKFMRNASDQVSEKMMASP